jgi:Uma2 family endonuclease
MNGIHPNRDGEVAPDVVVYPSGDGKPMAETGIHVMVMVALIATLKHHFRKRNDVYVTGNIFLYYRQGHPEARRSPDVMVIKGLNYNRERVVPCVVLEITSDKDCGARNALYQELGVREYVRFDPLHDFIEKSLSGYYLIGDRYKPMQPTLDGGLLSQELGMRLVPEGPNLGLISYRTGQRIPCPPEAYQLLGEAWRAADLEMQLERLR